MKIIELLILTAVIFVCGLIVLDLRPLLILSGSAVIAGVITLQG